MDFGPGVVYELTYLLNIKSWYVRPKILWTQLLLNRMADFA
jgi:hypothetical protein